MLICFVFFLWSDGVFQKVLQNDLQYYVVFQSKLIHYSFKVNMCEVFGLAAGGILGLLVGVWVFQKLLMS